jgi:hypothetical protein
MRSILATTATAALLAIAAADSAMAQNYPWCAQYGYRGDGGRNCGFVSYAQCMATVSGIGGYCETNAMYRPQANEGRPRKARRHR